MNKTGNLVGYKGLKGSALSIATTEKSPLRVLAGPGTGKSYALKMRVAHLLENGQQPERILAVTFTRNAAADLVRELNNLGIEGCEKVRAGTLHSFCFRLLNRKDVFEHLQRTPRPIVTFSKSGSLQFEGGVILDDLGLEPNYGNKRERTKRIRAFEAAWARLQSEEPGWPEDPIDSAFQEDLLDWLRFHNAMLIGELVPETLRFLRNNPLTDVLSAFDHVIVDEYQDLNRAEQELINCLAEHSLHAVVGDPNQSIYSFKHANPEGIDEFDVRHPYTHDETLSECRRCPTRVVAIANALISNNPKSSQTPLEMFPGNEEGNISIVQWQDSEAEAAGIASYIKHSIASGKAAPGEILLLTPRKQMGYQMRDLLKKLSIPVYSFYHEEALDNSEAQDAFALLNLLSDRNDRVALRWWLGRGSNNSLNKSYVALRTFCEDTGKSPRDVLEALRTGDLKISKTATLLKRYQDLTSLLDELLALEISDLIDHIFPEGQESVADLREVALLASQKANNFSELYDEIRSYITQPEVPDDDFVRIMSLHKSKGLTSKLTIVTGCNQGLIPFQDSDLPPAEGLAMLQEQRRLFYVAITRCTETLVISSFLTMPYAQAVRMQVKFKRLGAVGKTIASQFINELGPTAPKPKSGAAWQSANYK